MEVPRDNSSRKLLLPRGLKGQMGKWCDWHPVRMGPSETLEQARRRREIPPLLPPLSLRSACASHCLIREGSEGAVHREQQVEQRGEQIQGKQVEAKGGAAAWVMSLWGLTS